MITIKEAAQKAMEFCEQLYPGTTDFLLEEVEREDEKYWIITLSFPSNSINSDLTVKSLAQRYAGSQRKYKSLKIDAQTGEFVSMKIRELQS
ncbi:MAG: hypothetical protein EAZ91_04965 [Cytophagales bacterium]|nr:MAG: hypothetical protein EAZ91_04965 [Cytophagales bacterium]